MQYALSIRGKEKNTFTCPEPETAETVLKSAPHTCNRSNSTSKALTHITVGAVTSRCCLSLPLITPPWVRNSWSSVSKCTVASKILCRSSSTITPFNCVKRFKFKYSLVVGIYIGYKGILPYNKLYIYISTPTVCS